MTIREGWAPLGLPISPDELECDSCGRIATVVDAIAEKGWHVGTRSTRSVHAQTVVVIRHLCPKCVEKGTTVDGITQWWRAESL